MNNLENKKAIQKMTLNSSMRSRAISALLFCFCCTSMAFSQEECGGTENKKAEKLLEKGTNKKNAKGERISYLKQAIDEDENYVEAQWELAEILVKDARFKGTSYKPAESFLLKVVELCPDYHSSPYYYLGQIAMDKGEYEEAMHYYKTFYEFESDDESKFERRYDDYLAEAKENYKWAKFYYEQYANPVLFEPKKVAKVSTSKDEYLPLVTPDNEVMYFTRRFEDKTAAKNTYIKSDQVDFIEEFTTANRIGNSHQFEEGTALPSPFNEMEGVNYGGAAISITNKELYLTLCTPEGGMINCDLYQTKYIYGYNEASGKEEWHWTPLENMGPNINTSDGWEAQPTLSKDGDLLMFASAREGSQGIDIYQSRKLTNGYWGPAQRVNEPISTPQNDKTPYFHSDSKTLYYASQGHFGHGGYDVFYVKMKDDGTWGEPVNMGYPINSSADELGFVVSTDGTQVFFTSNKVGGREQPSLDIYSFRLYEEARPEKVILVKGNIRDENGEVPQDAVVEVKNSQTQKVEKFKVDSVSGDYTAMVTVESKNTKEPPQLIVNIKTPDKAFESFVVSSDTVGVGFKSKKDIEVKSISTGEGYQINDIYYTTNSADLKEESKLILEEFALWLKDHASIKIAIHGHTDNVGDAGDNLALSADRAFSVKQYLQSKGISGNRITFKGFGETKPIASNTTEEGRKKNRRTEFVIVSQ